VELLDLATCFFYAPEDVGRSKAEALIDNLVEMNPDDVIGKAFAQSPLDLVSDQSKLKGYSLLICADQKESVNKEVSQACCALNIPVVFITVAGFYVYVRNQQRLHFVES
jgi:molybdopterin/thiamine biosynthesis adenylyltransferase